MRAWPRMEKDGEGSLQTGQSMQSSVRDRVERGMRMARSSGTMGLLVREFPVLSSNARSFVRNHPREARAAIAAALEAVAAQRDIDDGTDVPEQLRPFVVHRSDDEAILGVSEAANRLEVSRTTVYEWVKTTKLIGWRATKRGLRIPAGQILGAARVVPGLKDIVDVIGEPELAWAFLTQEWAFEEKVELPLDLLKNGRINEVLGAASGFGDTFT